MKRRCEFKITYVTSVMERFSFNHLPAVKK